MPEAEETIELRMSPETAKRRLKLARRYCVAALALLAVTIVARGTELAAISGLLTAMAVMYGGYGWILHLGDRRCRTVVGPAGIVGRNLSGAYEYRWEQVANVLVEKTVAGDELRSFVVLETTGGDRIRLAVPSDESPEFEADFERIRDSWQAATGRTAHDAPGRGRGRSRPAGCLVVVGMLLGVASGLGLGIGLGRGAAADASGRALLAALAVTFVVSNVAHLAVPVVEQRRRQRRANQEMERLGGRLTY